MKLIYGIRDRDTHTYYQNCYPLQTTYYNYYVLSTLLNFSIGLILHVCMFSHHNIILYTIYVLYTILY